MDVALRVLGPPAVVDDGRWEALPCMRPEAVFLYLACAGRRVRRAVLTSLLWPDADESSAQTNLRQTLRMLANRPWGTHLQRDRFTASVVLGSDLAAFDRAIAKHRWAEAHDRYGGPFLDGFELDRADEFAGWVESERAAIASRWRRATSAGLDELRAARRWHDALAACDRLLEAEPLDEEALRWALQAAAAVGDLNGGERRYQAFRELLAREVGLEPEPATDALVDGLLRPTRRPSGALSVDSSVDSSFGPMRSVRLYPRHPIGREAEIDALAQRMLGEAGHLVTLLAPGGMGKTTLAAAVVGALRPAFGGAVAAVALDRVESQDAVAHAIARAAGIELDAAVGFAAQLVAGLHGRRALLWLDGFEPHLEDVDLLADLVSRCPDLRVLVTSRVRLGIAGEVVVPVEPLAVAEERSEPDDRTEPSPAAQLFLRAAARVGGDGALGEQDRDRVEHICRLLGGHPLAIELVAAWTDLVPVSDLVERVDDVWDLLRSVDGTFGARATDLEAVLMETWEQLPAEARDTWACLAVMPGTTERRVAAEVGGGWGALRRLVDRAIVTVQDDRVGMHALVARFGRERARERGLETRAWAAALTVWRERAAVEIDPATGQRVPWHPHDLDQATGAWLHAVVGADWGAIAEMAIGLLRALDRVGRARERISCARIAVDALRSAQGQMAERARARVAAFVSESIERRRATIDDAARIARRLRDPHALALAEAARFRHDARRVSNAHFLRARAAFERCGDAIGLAALLYDHGERQMLKGHVTEAESLLQESRALHRRLGDRVGEAMAIDILSTGPLYRGDAAEAARFAAEARAMFAAEGAAYRGAGTLATETWIALLTGPAAQAVELTETFVRTLARFGDEAIPAAVQRAAASTLTGDVNEVARQARLVLDLVGDDEHPEIVTVYAHDRLAWASARMGQTEAAARHLAAAVRLCRELDAPRWVAQAAAAAGELALATGRRREAAELMAVAWHHPGMHELARRRLVVSLGDLGAPAPPPRPAAEAMADEPLLRRIEVLVAGIRRSS